MPVVTLQKYALRQWAEGPGAKRAATWVSAVFIVLIGHSAANLTWRLVPAPSQSKAPPAPSTQIAQQNASGQSAADYAALSNLHLFGEYQPPQVAAQAAQPTEAPVTETPLRLNLLGILYDEDKPNARALIANEQGEEETYAVGAQIAPGATLDEIQKDHVILSRAGKREILKLPEERLTDGVDTSASTGGSTYDPNAYAPPPQEYQQPDYSNSGGGGGEYSPYGESQYNQNPKLGGEVAKTRSSPPPSITDGKNMRQIRDELTRNPEKIGSLIRASPVNKGKKFRGFRVSPGRDPALFHQLGLVSGDIVTSVNGVILDQPAKGFQAMQQIATASSVALTVERKGEQKQLFVALP